MKRTLLLIFAAILVVTGCEPKLNEQLSVTPATLEFDGTAGTQTLTVTSGGTWALTIPSDAAWVSSSNTYGKGSMTIEISVTENTPEARTASLTFNASGCPAVTVTINQAPGTGEAAGGDTPGEFYPVAESGITVDPALPDADASCTIKFNPDSSNPLYGHSGELFGHFGVVVDGEWKFVPSEWGVADEKVHFKKVADNSWEFKMEPSIREYFQSGETPVTKIALIVRSEDGSIKSHNDDQFCSVTDNKYQAEEFVPDPLVTKKLPEGVLHGINYNADGSVTFVLYDKDKSGNSHKYCYIVGDWNNWERKTEGAMYWDGSQGCWWITLGGFEADKEYRFQYRLGTGSGSDLYVSDPYTEIVYDQWNDQYIDGVPAFPEGAKALVSAFQINRPAYPWKHSDFVVEDKNDLSKSEILRLFGNYEKDALMDRYQVLFMKALYNLKVSDLHKFSPGDDHPADPHEAGQYYRDYVARIDNVLPDSEKSNVITPHLDRRWHFVGVLPDLDDRNEIKNISEAQKAFFIAFAFGYVRFYRDQYKFVDANGDYISDKIIVADGKCDKLHEVYDAMSISRPLVRDFIARYEKSILDEKNGVGIGNKDFTCSVLYKAISNMHFNKYNTIPVVSILEIPLLFKASVGSNAFDDDDAVAMLHNFIGILDDYLSEFYPDAHIRTNYLVRWLDEQTDLMLSNIAQYYDGGEEVILQKPFADILLSRLINNILGKFRNLSATCDAAGECYEKYQERWNALCEI